MLCREVIFITQATTFDGQIYSDCGGQDRIRVQIVVNILPRKYDAHCTKCLLGQRSSRTKSPKDHISVQKTLLRLLSSYCTKRTCLTIRGYISSQHLTQGSTAKQSLAKLDKVLVLSQPSKCNLRSDVVTHDWDCAATSLLTLFGANVDEVLSAGRS